MTFSETGSNLTEPTQSLILRWKDGEDAARNRLIEQLYPELQRIASARLRAERNSSLSTGDLINDVVVRLVKADTIRLTDRNHLIALASRVMRNILVDHARARQASSNRHIKVELLTQVEGAFRFDLSTLDAALLRLSAIDPSLTQLIEMRYFGGMTVLDVTEVTGIPEASVKRRWQVARAWLADALANPIEND